MNTKNGFTLIEVMTALLVIAIGVGGAIALITKTVSFGSNAVGQLAATYLAQEGVEIVRNIRDSNFLQIHVGASIPWDTGLTGCASGCEADYQSASLAPSQSRFLGFDASGLYSYAGSGGIFQRTIFIGGSGNMRTVNVTVSWQERGASHSVSASTVLYNWLNPAL